MAIFIMNHILKIHVIVCSVTFLCFIFCYYKLCSSERLFNYLSNDDAYVVVLEIYIYGIYCT